MWCPFFEAIATRDTCMEFPVEALSPGDIGKDLVAHHRAEPEAYDEEQSRAVLMLAAGMFGVHAVFSIRDVGKM